ncbi:NADP-dependent oxidoreductase [Actinotalea sp. BY-33]|uniref:NADP-dependent oxidoreductase n=1 Tax=Actinotalea soli TaxID=2819234 RepID=A0A939LTN4_9CELL|nr:NADP-dependent oxidoreductase [Actinotalea soli]MBO1752795.1 NADP-dependent oxidoreductase [Actinotalea soli]
MSTPTTTREVHLAQRPTGRPTAETFALVEADLPELAEGQVLVRTTAMSVDPYMRPRMNDVKSYVPPFQLGAPLDGGAVGEVMASRSPDRSVGDVVLHGLGWREHAVVDAVRTTRVDTSLAPAQAYLGALGMPGLTAYVGLTAVAELAEGDRVFVSGAAGAVGSLAVQMARLLGASQVVGSAGSAAKVTRLRELGVDAAFDYHDGPVAEQLAAAAPEGIDLYFDNVGGEHLEAAIASARQGGRIALCGAISQYDAAEARGPRNMFSAIGKGLTLRGFIVGTYAHLQPEFAQRMAGWLADGSIQTDETVVHGLENAPDAFIGMLGGQNTGKMIVALG